MAISAVDAKRESCPIARVHLCAQPGFLIVASLEPRAGGYRVVLTLNGARVKATHRRTLASAMRWALSLTARLLDLFNQTGSEISFGHAMRVAASSLAA